MTTFSRIAARPLAKAIRLGGNPVARVINRASWLAGKAGTRIAPAGYRMGATRTEIAEILKKEEFSVSWTDPENPQNAREWNDLRPDIVYDKGMNLFPGSLSRSMRRIRTVPPLRSIIDRHESYASSILKCIAERSPSKKADLGKYRSILRQLELEYSDLLEILIKRLPKDIVEDIDKFTAYCDFIKYITSQKGYYASSHNLDAEHLVKNLPVEILADIGKLRRIMEFMLQAPIRGWESEQIEYLCKSIISFLKTLPPASLKSDKLADFFTCTDGTGFATLSDNLTCFHVLAEEFRASLVPGEEDLDGSVLRKKLVDMIGRIPISKNNLERTLLIPPRMLMEAGRLEKAMEIVKEIGIDQVTETFSKVFPYGIRNPKEINFEVYYILMIVSSKSPAGTGLEGHMDAVLEALDNAGKKRYEKDIPGMMIHFMRGLVELAGLLPEKEVADIEKFRQSMGYWVKTFGVNLGDMTTHQYYLESLTIRRKLERCFPKEILSNDETFQKYWNALLESCERIIQWNGNPRVILDFMNSVSMFLKGLAPAAFEENRFVKFFKCKSDADIQYLSDIMTCYRVLAEDYEIKITTGPEEFDRDALKRKLLAAVKGLNLDFTLEGLFKIPVYFLREAGLMERIKSKIKETIPDFPDNLPYYTEAGLVSCMIKMRENWLWGSRMGHDKNILRLLDIVKRYNTIDAYYRKEKSKVLEELRKAGFEVDYLLGGEEVLSRDISGSNDLKEKAAPLSERFRELTRRIMGTRENKPEKYFGFNQNAGKLFQELGLKAALDGDRNAIEKAALALTKRIEAERHNNKDRVLEDWHDRLSGMLGEIAYGGQAMPLKRIRAVRSRKLFPEILFDNKRLGCCIFWPSGEEHTEIARIVLDPKTPLLEIWLEGGDESMGVVTQYLGTNASGKAALLVDTVEGSHFIYDQMGRNRSLRFILDALVLDAHKMGAKEVAVYKCGYGKPAEFVNFVKDQIKTSGGSITEAEKYSFKAVDAEDNALLDSDYTKHHYTDAFGLGARLEGEKPCLVIDVAAYVEKVLKIKPQKDH